MQNRNKYPAPTYYENFVTYDNVSYFDKVKESEWRGQIQSSAKNKKFKIKYYGDFYEKYGLITWSDTAPSLVVAEDVETGEQIVLFDGCKHGYNAMFCDKFSDEQINNRPLTHTFTNKHGNDVFEILVLTFNNIDYDEEKEDFVNENGEVPLMWGEIISFEDLKRNGFDFICIVAINALGERMNIVDEELA